MQNNKKAAICGGVLWIMTGVIAGCSSGGDGTADSGGSTAKEAGVCGESGDGVNWNALASTNCRYLSSYRLFSGADPTQTTGGTGVVYDLATPLFTDYASKYRVVYVPEGKQAQYSAQEIIDFPEGTVITKTFALPTDTANRGLDNERLLETRLLIRRASGWVALPYIWDANEDDAELSVAGGNYAATLVHNGVQQSFTYQVPDTNKCKQCHQFKTESGSRFVPLGPKARQLNWTYTYADGAANQLAYWKQKGILAGLPDDLSSIDSVPNYSDADASNLAGYSDDQIHRLAKGYLDINCAHCHRPEGGASNTGLSLEFWRSFADYQSQHGVCKQPVAYGGGALSYDIEPGSPDASIINFRMASDQPGDKMPEIGRQLVHQEGQALIHEWIARMATNDCVD
ncbi:hypothetical protein EUZ85_15620 [Hahella sp. KA22]|uniref:SO2930 family diheme c-type cytochrome n=1 Tax=Hahella sp. KA22 TaxID=1628392 RepID=UPI000FDE2DF6|nr:SO2930 family diheme c-type cytochrome [Hahella sp. KA22]AZZ92076.1 hypothetical protein ENC22_13055 [Hahella sp. KA22]QAY55447.1 hypothetical protein EUZ85_15620 [Hahella sp. KA22]